MKMINFKTNIPEIDKENVSLMQAAQILEQIGNEPNPSANEFYAQLAISDMPIEEHDGIVLAAMAIETMMLERHGTLETFGPTIH
tara:strand:+ start:207 stop:461 length:255 start_codon:yes stop_codon:yes gene_type:complete